MPKKFIIVLATIVACAMLLFVPWYFRSDHSSPDGCVYSLKAIAAAKEQWAFEQHKTTNDTPTWDDLRPYFSEHWHTACPRENYTIGRVGVLPTCSLGKQDPKHHALPK
jgi:hypothetical protein